MRKPHIISADALAAWYASDRERWCELVSSTTADGRGRKRIEVNGHGSIRVTWYEFATSASGAADWGTDVASAAQAYNDLG